MIPNPYAILGAIGVALFVFVGGIMAGYDYEHRRFEAFKVAIEQETHKKEAERQAATDLIRKAKDDQIRDINSKLFDAINELRKRPNRTEATSNGQSGTGATLFAEDGIFLTREADPYELNALKNTRLSAYAIAWIASSVSSSTA